MKLPFSVTPELTFLNITFHRASIPSVKVDPANYPDKYIKFLQVRDYVRLSHLAQDGYALDDLSEEDMVDVRSGKSLLVLDLSNEGPSFYREIWDSFHEKVAEKGLQLSNICLVQQNQLLAGDYHAVYGDTGLTFKTSDFFVVNAGGLFALNDVNETSKGEFAEICYSPVMPKPYGPIFLCLNGALRWSRILIYRHFMLSGLLKDGLISFMGAGPDNPKGHECDLDQPPADIAARLPEYVAGVRDWVPKQAIRFDNRPETGNNLADVLIPKAYARTCFSVVTESDFFIPGIKRVTEKTMKAACMGHPFIVIAPAGTLKIMRDYGFRTFPEVFDESYDDIEDNVERFRAVTAQIERTVAEVKADRAAWLARVAEPALFNFNHGLNGFIDVYRNTVVLDMIAGFDHFLQNGRLTVA